jgi:DNA-binding transcriptional regulator GbsR (MarR family)
VSSSDDALLRYVERLALTLRSSGMPPMAARVFAYVLAEDGERYTAAELAEALQASPASISGAVRYLVQGRLLGREREPGTRSDLYTLYDDHTWVRIMRDRLEGLVDYERVLLDGVAVVGADRPGGRRLAETAELFTYLRTELPKLLQRWADDRDAAEAARRASAPEAG